jgi:hypothetical protein
MLYKLFSPAKITEELSSLSIKVTDLPGCKAGDNEFTTPLIPHTTTMFSDAEMDAIITLASSLLPEDEETSEPHLPMLCINGVEVNLSAVEYEKHVSKVGQFLADSSTGFSNTAVLESWATEVPPSILKPVEPIVTSTLAAMEGHAPSLFGPPLSKASTFSALSSPIATPAVVVIGTAPVEAQGFIPSTFGSSLSNYGIFYTPSSPALMSTIPCKREGSPLEKTQNEENCATLLSQAVIQSVPSNPWDIAKSDNSSTVPSPITTPSSSVSTSPSAISYFDHVIETSFSAITPPNSPTLAKVLPAKIAPVPAPVVKTKYHEYDFRSRKPDIKQSSRLGDNEFLLEHSPHCIPRTENNNKAHLHPGQTLIFRRSRTKSESKAKSDSRSRRGTPLIALIRSLATVLDEAFDPIFGNLRREWLHEMRPQLFHKDGSMQEYLKVKDKPAGMDHSFFLWLKGDAKQTNEYSKERVKEIVRRVEFDQRMLAIYGLE